MEVQMGWSKLVGITCATAFLTGCFGGSDDKKDDGKASIEEARKYGLPESLKDNIDKNGLAKSGGELNPLEQELQTLKEKAEKDRKMLSMNTDKAEEYKRRAEELSSSLRATEAKISRVNRIISMINDNPDMLTAPSSTGSSDSVNDVPKIGASGPLGSKPSFSNELPALGAAPSGILSGGKPAPYNDFSPASTPAAPEVKKKEVLTPVKPRWGFAPPSDNPALAVDGPEFTEERAPVADNKWAGRAVSAATSDGKILLSDGSGPDSEYIISLGKNHDISEGMLFEATGSNGKRNVLVVTRVYKANAEAKLHPRYAAGGLKTGDSIHKLTSLPE